MIEVVLGDLREAETEAVVRSVNADLDGATTVCRRVGEGAGPEVTARLSGVGETPVGGALVTPGGQLRAPFLIHLVIRSREEPVSPAGLRRAITNGLRQATEWGIESLAIPPLGVGPGNMDAEGSARILIPCIRDHLREAALPSRVVIVVSSEYERDAFESELERTPHSG